MEPFYVNDCKGCGWCCIVVWMPPEYRRWEFCLDLPWYLRAISPEEAIRLNPWLPDFQRLCEEGWAFFTCENFVDGLCMDYENRPYMCTEYPFYGKPLDTKELPVPFCHYHRLRLP